MSLQTPHVLQHPAPAATRAGGSSFYLAMRILAREQRDAMFEIYSFCRAVDDIADGGGPRRRRIGQLAQWRADIESLYAGRVLPDIQRLADSVARFGLRKADFLTVIDGVEMDAREDIHAPKLKELELYCDRVACAVGRLSVRGMDEEPGRKLAHHLGLALQFINILRDIDEDAAAGRLYLPREALDAAGIGTNDPLAAVADPRVGIACEAIAIRAREHFTKASEIMNACPRQQVRAPRIMAEAYRQMLDDMSTRGWAPPRERVHVNKSHLLWVAFRYAFV
jgi:phytoene synthase